MSGKHVQASHAFVKASPTKSRRVPIAVITCPRCKKPDIEQLIEVWEGHVILFEIPARGQRYEEGFLQEGTPVGVKAKCACGHTWMLRGIRQIIDLDIPSTKK